MKTGIELIAIERLEHFVKHGRTVETDHIENNHYQLSEAAGLLCHLDPEEFGDDITACCPTGWDEAQWEKMMSKSYKDRLIIAGSLIAAEIDRIQSL